MKVIKNLEETLFGDDRPRYQRDVNREWRPARDEHRSFSKIKFRPWKGWVFLASPLSILGSYLMVRRCAPKGVTGTCLAAPTHEMQ